MRPRIRAIAAVAVALVLVAAACGDAGGDEEPTSGDDVTTTLPPTPTPATSAAPMTTAAPPTTVSAADAPPTGAEVAARPAERWVLRAIDEGVKPVLALDPDDSPAIAYLHEDLAGFIGYAAAADGWAPDRFVDGYFYGPIGLAFLPDGTPNVVYHDHQDTTFEPDKGDITHAVLAGGDWVIEPVFDPGHDGWDSTAVVGDDGILRAAGVDPQQFQSDVGVEYYEFDGSAWTVEPIGSGPIEYEWNVSIAVAPDGTPAISYYDNNTQELKIAIRSDAGWSIDTVDTGSDVGRFSSLAFDAGGTAHISYIEQQGGSLATVKYATGSPGAWTIEAVTELTNVALGFTGARRITDLAVGPDGTPHIAAGDEGVVRLATRSADGWGVEDVVTAGDRALGQLVSVDVGADGTPHLAFFEVTQSSPLNGVVVYATLR